MTETAPVKTRTSDEAIRRCLRLSTVFCGLALVAPVTTTIGWMLGIPLLAEGHPALPAMQPNGALGLALAAVAIGWMPDRPSATFRTATVVMLAAALASLGVLTLAEYAFGWDAGIDRLFLPVSAPAGHAFAGRPAPQTALNFTLLAIAIFSFMFAWRQIWLGQTAAIVTAANAIAAATGYIFSTQTPYGFPLYTQSIGMAVPTAITFLLLVLALFCRRPTVGMMTLMTSDTHSGRIMRRILVAGILAPPLIGTLARAGVVAGWYDVRRQGSVFVLLMAALMLRTVWDTARRSEHEELQAREAFDALERANEQLNRAVGERQIFAALVENSSDFIGIADPAGTPVYVNPAGRRMVGLPAEYPIGSTTIPDYYASDQRAFAEGVIVKGMVEQGHWEGETAFRHWQTGEPIPVSDTHFMIRTPDTGKVLGMGTITRDISEIKRAREETRLLYEKIKNLDELKTRFFANVSHELRTPLTLILGPIEKHLRAPGALDPNLRDDLEVIRRNAQTVLRHVNDLLDVARLEEGRVNAEYSAVDAAALVRIVADHFSTLARERRIEYVVDTPAALPVKTDSDKLQRILLNLLSNAFKFTPDAGRVRVSLLDRGPRFTVEVADSGPGVPLEQRDAVFERFRRLDTPARAPNAGTGLGLAIVSEFAALLGGRASVGGAPEGGAVFLIDLPSAAPAGAVVSPDRAKGVQSDDVERVVDVAHEAVAGAPSGVACAALTAPAEGRIVIAEDNVDMRRFIAQSLANEGFEVVTAVDGRDAYERVLAERPDLLLTDLMMPIMSGDELVRRLRQRTELNAMPIVVLTARADEDLRVVLLREGVQDYLDKPFSVAELRARVRNLIARKRAEEHVERLRGQLEAVALANMQISEAVASVPQESVRAVLQTIALCAQHLTGAQYAAAAIGRDETRPFDIWTFVGMSPAEATRVGRTPCPVGTLGLVSKTNHTLRLRDVRRHPDHRGFPPHHPDMWSFIGVPIRYRGQAVGNLYLSNKPGGAEFSAEDQQLVEMLAERAGVAIETARLYAAEGRAHAWLQAVVDQMPEGIILMDADGRVTMQNRSLHLLTNVRPPTPDRFGNPITMDLRRPTGEPLAADELPIVKAIIGHEITRGEELLGRRADDRLVPLLVSAAPILSADGTMGGAAMVFQDISALKELEQLREEWATIVAHDLRQPISVITLRSALLLRAGLAEAQRDDVRQIRNSAERLSRMASDLMDASLVETRRMRVALDRLDLGALVAEVVVRAPLVAQRAIVKMPADRRLFIKGDAQRLEQVIANLLSNAAKYGEPGTAIGVEVAEVGDDADIRVANRGAGIPPDELPLVFERYARSQAARSSKTRGLGLGLYIARGLVEAHGGRIWAESVPGELTAFHVVIPLDGPPAPMSAAAGAEPELVERS